MENEATPAAVSEPPKTPSPNALPPETMPICPYCNADPLILAGKHFNISKYKLLLLFCSACKRVVPTLLLNPEIPRMAPGNGPFIIP